jgi:hypothetical protein
MQAASDLPFADNRLASKLLQKYASMRGRSRYAEENKQDDENRKKTFHAWRDTSQTSNKGGGIPH